MEFVVVNLEYPLSNFENCVTVHRAGALLLWLFAAVFNREGEPAGRGVPLVIPRVPCAGVRQA